MERLTKTPQLGTSLTAVVRRRLGADPWSLELVDQFLGTPRYERSFARSLLTLTKNRAEPWPLRKAAALMLEHQLLLAPDRELAQWCKELGAEHPAHARARMARLERIHAALRGRETTANALDDFLHISSRDCRVTLGRYVWSVDEVVAEIERQVRHSRGMAADAKYVHPDTDKEIAHHLQSLPRFEREIVLALLQGPVIRWVDDATPGEINSLVEYPLGSVVLVIKPPGSDVEIEIKRAGIRGPRPFDIKIWREGKRVPRSHHLQGGSMLHLLQWESCQSAFFSRLYRLVHGEDATMSRTLQLSSIYGIPSRVGELQPLDYFTQPAVFDRQYRHVHNDMHFISDILSMKDPRTLVVRTPKQNPIATAVRFLGVTRPAQAVQLGNSAFRLDKVAHYLASGGAAEYFRDGLKRHYNRQDARRFTDELLDEVLCVYQPPDVEYRTHRQYVRDAFRVSANRERATKNFLAVMEQTGRFWGTLYAAGGHTDGESFVGRNTGLRSVWEDGQWRIRITFMDNDGMQLIGQNLAWFHPRGTLADQRGDYNFVMGRNTKAVRMKGLLGFLQMIYRIDHAGRKRGLEVLRASMKDAFERTREALRSDAETRERFNSSYLDRLEFWHQTVAGHLATNRSKAKRNAWRRRTEETMVGLDYPDNLRDEHFSTLRRRSRLLNCLAFLYKT